MRALARRLWYALLADPPLAYAGRPLLAVLPAARVADVRARALAGRRADLVSRAVEAALEARFRRAAPSEQMAVNRAAVWGGPAGRAWHAEKTHSRADPAVRAHDFRYKSALADLLAEVLDGRPADVCEVGTGNGMFLADLAERLPGGTFTGLDINAAQVEANRRAGAPLRFVHAEAAGWIDQHGADVVVAAGTLQYLPEPELRALLGVVARRAALLALVEPVEMDLAREGRSRYRARYSFSHNYPVLCREAGLRVVRQRLIPLDPARPDYQNVLLVARAPDA